MRVVAQGLLGRASNLQQLARTADCLWLAEACRCASSVCGSGCLVGGHLPSSWLEEGFTKSFIHSFILGVRRVIADLHPAPCAQLPQVLAQQQKMDPRVFSRFVTTYTCDGKETQHTMYIEPLSHGLRHPNALCNRGTDLMDRTYLLPAHKADHATARKLGNVHCQNRTCQTMYFDLGATTLQPTPDEAGQGWFFNAYKRQGITFDRFLLWEAVTRAPAEVFKNVPKADMHKYQYFNIPVTPDTADLSNPVNILKVRWC